MLPFFRACKEEFIEKNPTENEIKAIEYGYIKRIYLNKKCLSLYSMVCVGNLIRIKQLSRIDIHDCGVTKHHIKALDITLGGEEDKVTIYLKTGTSVYSPP